MVGTSSKKPTSSTSENKTPGNAAAAPAKEQVAAKEQASIKETEVQAQDERREPQEKTEDIGLNAERSATVNESKTIAPKDSSQNNPTPFDDNANQVIHDKNTGDQVIHKATSEVLHDKDTSHEVTEDKAQVSESGAQPCIGRRAPSGDSDIEGLYEGQIKLKDKAQDSESGAQHCIGRRAPSDDSDIEVLYEVQAPAHYYAEALLEEQSTDRGSTSKAILERKATPYRIPEEILTSDSDIEVLDESPSEDSNEELPHEEQAAAANAPEQAPPSDVQSSRGQPIINIIYQGQVVPYYIQELHQSETSDSEIQVLHTGQPDPDVSSEEGYVDFFLEAVPGGACAAAIPVESKEERAKKEKYAAYVKSLPEINPKNILKGTGGRRNQSLVPPNVRRHTYRSLTQRMLMDESKEIVDVTKEKQKKKRFGCKYDDDTSEDEDEEDDDDESDSYLDEFKPPKHDSPSPDLQFNMEL